MNTVSNSQVAGSAGPLRPMIYAQCPLDVQRVQRVQRVQKIIGFPLHSTRERRRMVRRYVRVALSIFAWPWLSICFSGKLNGTLWLYLTARGVLALFPIAPQTVTSVSLSRS